VGALVWIEPFLYVARTSNYKNKIVPSFSLCANTWSHYSWRAREVLSSSSAVFNRQ